jgi:hypothetical protein
MDHQENQASLPPATAGLPALDTRGTARRRFARLGAGTATGVILTLHSQPGMTAEGLRCETPSGFMSRTPNSRSPQNACEYNRSHRYWKTHPEEWKSRAGVTPRTRFGRVFPTSGNYADLAGVTLMEVLDPSPAIKAIDAENVAMQTVAAYLNARAAQYAGQPNVLPEDRVLAIWTDFVTKGYYSPDLGATFWTGGQIAFYLESTFR